MTRLLAFDTSTEAMSIALCLPDRTLLHEGPGGALASAQLLPTIRGLMAQGGISFAQLDAIGFGRGPGAFTGLRTACSVAQGLALGIGRPVLPLDSLMVVAQDALDGTETRPSHDAFELWVAMDARMDEVYAARYRWPGDSAAAQWQVSSAPALYTLAALADRWTSEPALCVAGSAVGAFADRLPWGTARRIPTTRSRAAALSALARRSWLRGEAVDAALALPIYLRDKVAQTTAERDATRAARELAT